MNRRLPPSGRDRKGKARRAERKGTSIDGSTSSLSSSSKARKLEPLMSAGDSGKAATNAR
jgi:hypothetical protein